MKQKYIKEFKVDISGLTVDEKKVVGLLVQAAKLIAPIYEKQVNDRYPGANFYPHDATREEIEKANQKDPAILDPYTIVERKDGKLVAIPYHVKYKKELEPVAKLLRQAAKITKNKEWAKRLEFQSEALLNGSYEVSDIYWLEMKPYKIDIMIGPLERYDDRLFFTKCCYVADVGIMDEKATQEALQLKKTILLAKRKMFFPSEKIEYLDKIQMKVDRTLIFAGLDAKGMFTAADTPNDPTLLEKYGSQVIIFGTSLDFKFDKVYHPIFHTIFEKQFQSSFPVDLMRQATFRISLLHEIGHTLLRFRDAEKRLGKFFPIIDEIAATILGIKSCGSLLLKGVISQKELETIMVMFICRAFDWWLESRYNETVIHYAMGHTIALNYLLANGGIREAHGFSWPNFTKMFVSLDELSENLERLLTFGTKEDVQRFIEKYKSPEIFVKFQSRLRKLFSEGRLK